MALKQNTFTTLPARIFQRKWLIIVPVAVVMSLVSGYAKNVDLFRSSAIVSFQTEYMLADRDQAIQSLFEDKMQSVVGSLRFGDPLRSITSKVWPELDPDENPVQFNNKAQKLGGDSGVQLAFRRDNYRALNISYTSSNPEEAYKVVQATIDTLIEEARARTARRVTSSAAFLESEITKYQQKLKALDKEIVRIESGLGSDEQGDTFVATAGSGPDANPFLNKNKYRRTLPQLEFDLKVETRELDRLRTKLNDKEYLQNEEDLSEVLAQVDDPILAEVRDTLANKQKEKSLLSSQGYLAKHPKQRALAAEINNLRQLEKSRLTELRSQSDSQTFETAKVKMESRLRQKISEKSAEVQRISDRISVMKQYEAELGAQQSELVSHLDVISAQRSRLEQLKHEKNVTGEAFHQAVSELELIGRQGRADADEIGLRIIVSEPPKVPKNPLPLAHMSTIVMGLAISLAIGIGLICLLESMDSSVRNAAELRAIVPVPVIGEVDKMISTEELTSRRIKIGALCAFLFLFVLFSEQLVLRLI